MIQLSEKYSCKPGAKAGWELYTWGMGLNKKTGEMVRSSKVTYHSNLIQLLNKIIDTEAGNCESVEELKEMLQHAQHKLLPGVEALTK